MLDKPAVMHESPALESKFLDIAGGRVEMVVKQSKLAGRRLEMVVKQSSLMAG